MGAAHPGEGGASLYGRRRVGRRRGRSQHPHEVGKRLDVGDDGRIGMAAVVGVVVKLSVSFGVGDVDDSPGLVALLREQWFEIPISTL